MEKEALRLLLEKYTANQCSEAEVTQLIRHIRSGRDRETVESFFAEGVFADPANDVRHIPGVRESLARVFERVQETKHHHRKPVRRLATIAAAAAAILVFFSVGLYWYVSVRQPAGPGQVALQQGTDVLPGGNRAILTFDDGQHIALSDTHQGIILGETLRYDDGTSVEAPDLRAVEFAQLTTPNGGQYQLTLPDGTEVWLNAASSLRYPTRFGGTERVVELDGEAYFDVTRNVSQPFIVKSRGQEIEVLGTEFNVFAYGDEAETRTTLVRGSVKVLHAITGDSQVLTPGEQAIHTDDQLRLTAADLTTVTAWKNGRFLFTGKSFETVMAELARWYDIEIVYADGVPDVRFFGGIHRDNNLSSVLQVLENVDIDFSIEDGKRLIIRQKKGGKP